MSVVSKNGIISFFIVSEVSNSCLILLDFRHH